MKTVKAHLETLPEPYRSKALSYVEPHMLDHEVASLPNALQSFMWHKTEELDIYWRDLFRRVIERDRILEKLNTIDTRSYTSKQVVDELKRWAKEL